MPHLSSIVRRVILEAGEAGAPDSIAVLPSADPPASATTTPDSDSKSVGPSSEPVAQALPFKRRKIKLQERERVYWSTVASTIGTYKATGQFPGEDKVKAAAGVYETYPYSLPGVIHLGVEISEGEPDSVWWGAKGSFKPLAKDWKAWKAASNRELKDMGITTRSKARMLTALTIVIPVITAAATAAVTALAGPAAASLVGAAGGALETQLSQEAKDARAKVAQMSKRGPEELAPTVMQAAGDAAGAAVSAKLAKK
jgi:hypothetical protein